MNNITQNLPKEYEYDVQKIISYITKKDYTNNCQVNLNKDTYIGEEKVITQDFIRINAEKDNLRLEIEFSLKSQI